MNMYRKHVLELHVPAKHIYALHIFALHFKPNHLSIQGVILYAVSYLLGNKKT